MKKILFVTNNSSHGGAEKMLIWLSNKMSEHQDLKIFFCNLNNKRPFYELNKNIEIILYNKKCNESFIKRNTIQFLKKNFFLMNIIKKNNIDLVINFNDHAYYNILFCKLFAKFKILISQRVDPGSINSRTGKIRLRLIKYADGLVCQTNTALEFFENIFTKKTTVIPNPILYKSDTLWNSANTTNTIINVARLELKQKRQDVLLDAFAIVHKRYPNLKLLLYGAKIDSDYEKIIKRIYELKLDKNVCYCGVSTDILGEMRKSKMLVLSSDYEGIPNAILEGMSLGMPIVSTDCKPGGARMLLDNGCGIITKRGDANLLAQGMLKILDDTNNAKSMGRLAYNSTERFNENKIANKWYVYINNLF